jgi:hypothetical protein
MEVPIFIAKIAAVIYLCVGLGALFNKKHFMRVLEDYAKDAGLDYLGALMALILGFLMINVYNVWAWNWTVLITLLGWGSLLKGAIHLLFPEQTMILTQRYLKMDVFGIIVTLCLVLGLVFSYFGFFTIA